MTRGQAVLLLDIPADAAAEQIESAYRSLRNDLQQRLLQAPVEGLKEKYRQELERVEQARALLLAGRPANPEDLPALRPAYQAAKGGAPAPTTAEAAPAAAAPPLPRRSGAGKYILLVVLLILVAGAFAWLTQMGPLQGWWQETMRDKALVAEIGGMAEEIESLESDWGELQEEIGGEAPPEVSNARRLGDRAEAHLLKMEDDLAKAAYEEAKNLWESALASGRKEQARQRTEALDRARAEKDRANILRERLEQASGRIEADLREAKSQVRSLEGRSGTDADALRRANSERGPAAGVREPWPRAGLRKQAV